MNYHLVGKKLAEDLKLKFKSLKLKYFLEAVSHGASFKESGPKTKKTQEKKILNGGQNLKDHWPLA